MLDELSFMRNYSVWSDFAAHPDLSRYSMEYSLLPEPSSVRWMMTGSTTGYYFGIKAVREGA